MESYNSHCNDGSDEYSGTDDSVTDDSSIDGSIINDLRIKKSSTDKSEISNHGINNPGTNNPDTDESGIQNIRTDGSIYTPIDLDRPAFRLLRILKGCDPLIPCELFQAWMMQPISYVWGSPERERRVSINGILYQALSYLQSEDEDRVVWVDAICINQRNDVERGHQVRHMSDVYKEASRVIYWLGPPTYSTNCCLRGLQLLQEETMQIGTRTWMREQWMAVWKSLEASSRWHPGLEREGLRDLLGRSWFRRVWILQEVANSQAAVVCCGKYSISTRLFTLAPFLMGVNTGPHCQGILDMMPGPFRGSSWFNESRDLYTLLEKFGGSETTEDRDLVYAVLGLSSDAIHVIRPDYQKTEAEVVDTVMTFLFQGLCSRNSNPGTFPSSLRELCQRLKILNEKALETAASDEVNGDAAIAFHLRRRPLLAISWVTVHTAAQNKRKGSQITKVILDNHEMTSREFLHGSKLMEGSAKNDSLPFEGYSPPTSH
ncbi:heterokaryon incompatibility protein-domain-containing protein [Triangularia setosa]|uniref:Heterokaryon incompatibility protein-domain-containing protein n=1 Tax=Triangularia setosa TaxID=2587417 RepID=A0AAN6VZ70_9PEZI|nr:heterokaryon incompatibility protein-domain-containing protein [Podospora setosa]